MNPQNFSIITLLFFFPLVMAQILIPNACSPTKIQCVGEGQTCSFDTVNGEKGCLSSSMTVCRVCRDTDLTCHAGICMKNLGKEGDDCDEDRSTTDDDFYEFPDSEHIACKKGLFCTGGKCSKNSEADELEKLLKKARGRGEACDEESICAGNLICDPSGKCAWPLCGPVPSGCKQHLVEQECESDVSCNWLGPEANFVVGASQRYLRCNFLNDCGFEEYCESGSCLPGIATGSRLGAACLAQTYEGDKQCGEGMICTERNPWEQNPKFNSLVCKWQNIYKQTRQEGMFSRKEGELCKSDVDCANPGTYVYCSSGVCTKPDLTHLGEGCSTGGTGECGRGLTCGCPDYGDTSGGRTRCVRSTKRSNEQTEIRNQHIKNMRALISCSTQNKCIPFLPKSIEITSPRTQFLSYIYSGDPSEPMRKVHGTNCLVKNCNARIQAVNNNRVAYLRTLGQNKDALVTNICSYISAQRSESAKYEGVEFSGAGNTRSMSWCITIIVSLVLSFCSQW